MANDDTARDTLAADRLDRAWDALLTGHDAVSDVDPARAATIQRLRDLSNHPASDAARGRVWRRVSAPMDHAPIYQEEPMQHAASDAHRHSLSTSDGRVHQALPTGLTAPSQSRRLTFLRRRVVLETLAAAVLLLIVAGGIVALAAGYRSLERVPMLGGLIESRQENPWRAGGEFSGGGMLATLPAPPAAVHLLRATFEPNAWWEIPDGSSVLVATRVGGLTVEPTSGAPGEPFLITGNSIADAEGPAALSNYGAEPVTVLIATVAPTTFEIGPRTGVEIEELAAGSVNELPGEQGYFMFGDARLGKGVALSAPPMLTDTGRAGLSVVWTETGTVQVHVPTGSIQLRHADGREFDAPVSSESETIGLGQGDAAFLTGGAAFDLTNESDSEARVTIFSIVNLERISDGNLLAAIQGTPTSGAIPASTPVTGAEGTPQAPNVLAEVIDPSECTVEPRTVAEMEQLLATPAADANDYGPFIEREDQLPQGSPADAETIDTVTAFEREFVACYNAGNVAGILALLGDDAARILLIDLLDRQENPSIADVLAAPLEPLPLEEQVLLFPVRDVRVLEDGRIGAVVEWGAPNEAEGSVAEANFHIYEQVDSQWLIVDELGSFVPDRQQG